MQSSFLQLEGIRLHYVEKNPSAPLSLFLIPGNSLSTSIWRKQWDSPLFNNFRIIALDLPGHGLSDPAADPESSYSLPELGVLMAAAINTLSQHKSFFLAGVSLGTNIAAEALSHLRDPLGLVLAGPSIVGGSTGIGQLLLPNTHVSVVFTDDATEADVQAYAKETSISEDPEDYHNFLKDYAQTQKPFRSVLGGQIAAGNYSDHIGIIQQRNISVQLIFGGDEKVINNNYLDEVSLPVWNNRIEKIAGASHLVQIDRPDEFNRLMSAFLRERAKEAGF